MRGPHETSVQIRFLIALFKEYKKSKIISFQEGGIGKNSQANVPHSMKKISF